MKLLILAAYLLVLLFQCLLRALNLRHLKRHGAVVPPGFEAVVDGESLAKASAYTVEKSRLGLVESLLGSALFLFFLFGGLLPHYDAWVASLSDSFVLSGVLFFFILATAKGILDIPFGLYRNFSIEKRYGFNTMTLKLFLADLVKGTLVSTVLLVVLLGGGLYLVAWSPEHWFLWVWGFFAFFTIFFMYLSPYLIEPLFFKFEPVKKEGVEEGIRALMERADLAAGPVLQVDASRRSRHSNAYFTGIGRVKRIVLFDTLLEQMDTEEILAILAHEVGHWKKRHILKRLLVTEISALVFLFAAHLILGGGALPGIFGLEGASFHAQALILFFLASIATFPLTPFFSWSSRRHEWQADRIAVDLCRRPEALASALIKLSGENLSNLYPHPLYALFYYSHPPVVERVAELQETGDRRQETGDRKT